MGAHETSTAATPSACRSAARRRGFHHTRIGEAASARDRLWRVVDWVVAEARRLPEDELARLTAVLQQLAESLNGRSGQ